MAFSSFPITIWYFLMISITSSLLPVHGQFYEDYGQVLSKPTGDDYSYGSYDNFVDDSAVTRQQTTPNTNLRIKIFNGEFAKPNEFPWMVRLEILYDSSNRIINDYCGGTLIDRNWVLTAAHCVNNSKGITRHIIANFGEHNTVIANETGEQRLIPDRYFVHPKYIKSPYQPEYDFALLKFQTPIGFTDKINPIRLPDSMCRTGYTANTQPPIDGCSNVVSAGWGLTETTQFATTLKKISLALKPYSFCVDQLHDRFSDDKICAFNPDGDTCQRDSGGPLMCRNATTNQLFLIGVTSYGSQDCSRGNPGVYARLCRVIPWLRTFVRKVGVPCMEPFPTIDEGYASKTSIDDGAVMPIRCFMGFEATNGSAVTCVDGKWIIRGRCNPAAIRTTTIRTTTPWDRCQVPSLPNAVILLGGVPIGAVRFLRPGDQIEVVCAEGFELADSYYSLLTCGRNSLWQPSVSRPCRERQNIAGNGCYESALPTVRNGNFRIASGAQQKVAVGTRRALICDRGFMTSGSLWVYCQQYGYWSMPGTCIAASR